MRDRSKGKDRKKGKASVKKEGGRGWTLEMCGRLRQEIGMQMYFVRPNGLRENAETAISCRGPGPIRKKEEVVLRIPVVEGGGRCADVPLWQSSRE